ncbi:unnamed protein product [marine sediment metagenome]|uniref:Uncharacterized protein n=1 Tax=marine sediment metagenome TaxID=412755 RepID=X1HXV2_9ZZZZ
MKEFLIYVIVFLFGYVSCLVVLLANRKAYWREINIRAKKEVEEFKKNV